MKQNSQINFQLVFWFHSVSIYVFKDSIWQNFSAIFCLMIVHQAYCETVLIKKRKFCSLYPVLCSLIIWWPVWELFIFLWLSDE